MRKEDLDSEEDAAQALTESPAPLKQPALWTKMTEIEEEDLLGEATLAKLSVSRKPSEEDEDEDEDEKDVEDEEKPKSRSRKVKEDVVEILDEEEVESDNDADEEVDEEPASDSEEKAE